MSEAESADTLETFWRNLYLRCPLIFDPVGTIAGDDYDQPRTGLPFGRIFVIGPDQKVALPLFGHDPDRVIAFVEELLATMPLGLHARSATVGIGEDLTLTSFGAVPGSPSLLFLTEVNGVPRFQCIASGPCDERGARRFSFAVTDPSLVGLDLSFQDVGLRAVTGKLAISEPQSISIR